MIIDIIMIVDTMMINEGQATVTGPKIGMTSKVNESKIETGGVLIPDQRV